MGKKDQLCLKVRDFLLCGRVRIVLGDLIPCTADGKSGGRE